MGSNVKITNEDAIEAIEEMSEEVFIGEDKDRLPEELLIYFRIKNIFYSKLLLEALLANDNKYINQNPFDNVIDNTNVAMDICNLDMHHWTDLYLDNLIIKHSLNGC